MATKTISQLTENSNPAAASVMELEDSTATPVSGKISIESLAAKLFTETATSTTKRSNARSNLDVLWADDARGQDESRAPVGGLWFDGTVTNRVAGASGASLLSVGTGDFSIAFTLTALDWTPSTSPQFFYSHSAGNNRFYLLVASSGVFRLQIVDGAGVDTAYSMTPDVALVDGETYHFVISVDRDGNATLYINGVSDRDKSGSGVTVDVSGASAVDFGSGNTNGYYVGYNYPGLTIHSFAIYNRLLSSSDALRLTKRGKVPHSDQWGNLSELISSTTDRDFSVSAGNWAAVGTGASVSYDAANDELDVTVGNTSTGARLSSSFAPTEAGKRYRTTFTIRNLSAGTVTLALSGSNQSALTGITNGTYTVEYVVQSASTGIMFIGSNAAATFSIDDVSHKQIGAILDLDLQSANPSHSLAVRDRSSNANHGTAAASGVAQVLKHPQINPSRLTVGYSTVVTGIISATAALDFGSINSLASADLTITATGAATGDAVFLGPPSSWTSGIIYQAFVSASDTVTVRATNITGGSIDPASATFRVVVFKF